jgi:LCP family protein required for cell wall assembly
MNQNQKFKISEQQPDNFNFGHKQIANNWLKRPWYLMVLILLVVIIAGSVIYQKAGSMRESVITENKSDSPLGLDSNVSGASFLEESDINNNLVNILLLGTGGPNHPGGGLIDVIQVLSINPKKNKAFIFSVPRDLYVKIDGFGWHKINTAYNLGQQMGHGEGGALAKEEVGQVVGLDIHYYIKVNFEGFSEIINLLDGVNICVDEPINDSVQGMYISQGCQSMNGSTALDYVRSRYSTSDFDRSARQQKTMMAIKDKALKLDFLLNPIKIRQAFSELVGNLNTDIQLSEIREITSIVSKLDTSKIKSYVLDNRKDNLLYSTTKYGAYVLLPVSGDFKQIRKFVSKIIPK